MVVVGLSYKKKEVALKLNREEYIERLASLTDIDNVVIDAQVFLTDLILKTRVEVSKEYNITQNSLVKFTELNKELIHDFKALYKEKMAEQILETFEYTRNINKICDSMDMSKYKLISELIQYYYINDLVHVIEYTDLCTTLSNLTYTNSLKIIAERLQESEDDIVKYLNNSAKERVEEHSKLEKKVALMFGLNKVGLTVGEIGSYLGLNHRFVIRMLDKYEKEMIQISDELCLFNRINTMKEQKHTDEMIATELEIPLALLHIIYREMNNIA